MQNLAGVIPLIANCAVRSELQTALIPMIDIAPHYRHHEVSAEVAGVLEFSHGVVFGFQRAWYYHVVKGTHPLPHNAAASLNKTWGPEVRVNGFAGGCDVPPEGVKEWHVDTLAGLSVLSQSLKFFFGLYSPTVSRSVDDLRLMRVLRDVEPYRPR